MNLQEAIQNLTGATARLEALTAERNTAQEGLTAANARIVELEAQIAAAPVDQSAEVARLTAELATSAEQVVALTASQADFDTKVTKAANAEAARIIASAGHPPVDTVSGAKSEGDSQKNPAEGLKGKAAAAAIFAAQRAEKNKTQVSTK